MPISKLQEAIAEERKRLFPKKKRIKVGIYNPNAIRTERELKKFLKTWSGNVGGSHREKMNLK